MLHSSRHAMEVEADDDDDIPLSSDDEQLDERKHHQLLKSIREASQKSKKQRKQSRDVSALNPGAARESVAAVATTDSFKNLKNKIKVVEDPLPRHKVEALERTVAYEEVCQDLAKWDPVIKENRRAPQLIFPAQRASWSNNFLYHNNRNLVPRTPLELELAASLKECQDDLPSRKSGMTPREKRDLKTVSAEQAKAYLQEVRKHRDLLSYKQAKEKWASKIKSKRWLKRMRKTRLEREAQELSVLEEKDPKAFREKMKEFEKLRMEERMSLKHRGSKQFRKKARVFGKYDDKVRNAVKEMMETGQELREKLRNNMSDSEEEGEEEDEMDKPHVEKPPTSDIYSKPKPIANRMSEEEEEETSDEEGPFISETLIMKRTLQEVEDEEGYEQEDSKPKPPKVLKASKTEVAAVLDNLKASEVSALDPATTGITFPVDVNDADSDTELNTMEEALATEDVQVMFRERKKEIEDQDNPKDISTYVPGWNDWAGPGITVSKRKLRRFTQKARKRPPSKRTAIGHVIYHKVENPEADKHRVKNIPFPFTSREQYERSLQQPIGRAFNTELAHRELCKPRVVTKLGAIIKPMSKDEVFSKQQQQQRHPCPHQQEQQGKPKKKQQSKQEQRQQQQKRLQEVNQLRKQQRAKSQQTKKDSKKGKKKTKRKEMKKKAEEEKE